MTRRKDEEWAEPASPLEVAKEALVREIRKRPPPADLTPLCNALAKLLAIEAKINEGDTYMKAWDGEPDDPPTPAAKPT